MTKEEKPASTRTVDRALTILTEVALGDGLILQDLAEATDLPPSTVLRIVRTLEAADYISRDDKGRYRGSSRLFQIASRSMNREPLFRLAQKHLDSLRDLTEETTYLGVPGPNHTVLYALVSESRQRLRHAPWRGRTIPREGTAIGAAIEGSAGTPNFVATRRTLVDDVTAAAAAIYLPNGDVAGALSIVAPTFRMDDERLAWAGELVLQHATALSNELGADLSESYSVPALTPVVNHKRIGV